MFRYINGNAEVSTRELESVEDGSFHSRMLPVLGYLSLAFNYQGSVNYCIGWCLRAIVLRIRFTHITGTSSVSIGELHEER